MNEAEKQALEEAGWKFGTAQDFLALSDAEMEIIAARAKLASEVRRRRQANKVSQPTFAQILKTSQSRVSLIESADPGVSFDQLIKAMIAAGATLKEVGETIGSASVAPARSVRKRVPQPASRASRTTARKPTRKKAAGERPPRSIAD
ncbi:MAG TPA: XRE family transcriptional regulator [Pirellulaceae bacterium]|jgi:transcriptional regulator with XRE-family HTH domain|nr:XRE family transcriptional regulator [Pirellulaceae bacterium]